MHDLKPGTGFVPSLETRRFWLGTRKNEKVKASITLGGLFQTADFAKDSAFMWMAIFADLLGIGFLIYLGRFNTVIIIVGIILILVDLIGAFLVHLRVSKKTAIKSLKVLHTNQSVKDKDERSLKGMMMFWEIFGGILIIASCAIKVMGIVALGRGAMAIIVGLSIVYGAIAYIHLKISGYAIWEYWFSSKLKKEYKISNSQDPNKENIQHIFFSERELSPTKYHDTSIEKIWYSKELEKNRFKSGVTHDYSELLANEMEALLNNKDKKIETKTDREEKSHHEMVYTAVLNNIYNNENIINDEEKIKMKLYRVFCKGIPTDDAIHHIVDFQNTEDNRTLIVKELLKFQLMYLGYSPNISIVDAENSDKSSNV